MHGGSTHFPIVLALVALACGAVARLTRSDLRRSEVDRLGVWALWLAALCSIAAALSGLALSKWATIGTGTLARHHLFVWPGFSLLIGLAVWRLAAPTLASKKLEMAYLVVLTIAALSIMIAAFWGGELVLMKD
jgi:uncharacterized membrane protein